MTAPTLTSSHVSPRPVPRVLSIAGTDPTGGAGTAADTKAVAAAGGFAMSVTTAVVAQNTEGVRSIHTPPAETLRAQLDAVGDDVTIDAVKTGMLGTAETIAVVEEWLAERDVPLLVIDPVMVATSGHRLLPEDAVDAMRAFCERATVVTPNIGELAVLTGQDEAATEDEAIAQARRWSDRHGVAVVVKTGHLSGDRATNVWVAPGAEPVAVPCRRIETTSTHGTGCSLASALATRLAQGHGPADALAWATDWLHESVLHGAALEVGRGHGPVDHGHRARRLAAAADPSPWVDEALLDGAFERPEDVAAPDPSGEGDGTDAVLPDAAVPDAAVPEPSVAPVGPWTEALWRASADLARRIGATDFVRALTDGTLSRAQFEFYLGQDALYLAEYSHALAALAVRAPSSDDVVFWAESSRTCIVTESALHTTFLEGRLPTEPGPVTEHYTSFLVSTALTRNYAVGVAAVLPCFWLYAQVGASVPEVAVGHPFGAWLETYRDPGFTDGVTAALQVVERALAAASPADRRAALRAYLVASRHELEFFEQATRLDPGAGTA